MTWLVDLTRGWTDSQLYMAFFLLSVMAVTVAWQTVYLLRRSLRATVRATPPNRPPYDWQRDTFYRQAINIRRRAS
jgi:hypothetical protein